MFIRPRSRLVAVPTASVCVCCCGPEWASSVISPPENSMLQKECTGSGLSHVADGGYFASSTGPSRYRFNRCRSIAIDVLNYPCSFAARRSAVIRAR